MFPWIPADQIRTTPADEPPRFFLDDTYDSSVDADWWLDLGRVDLPSAPAA